MTSNSDAVIEKVAIAIADNMSSPFILAMGLGLPIRFRAIMYPWAKAVLAVLEGGDGLGKGLQVISQSLAEGACVLNKRLGAEAMREACAVYLEGAADDWDAKGGAVCKQEAAEIRNLKLP